MKENHLSIWFIIGLQLAIIGLIVLAATIYGLIIPPANPVMFDNLHPGLSEGLVLIVLGAVYIIKFRPVRPSTTAPL